MSDLKNADFECPFVPGELYQIIDKKHAFSGIHGYPVVFLVLDVYSDNDRRAQIDEYWQIRTEPGYVIEIFILSKNTKDRLWHTEQVYYLNKFDKVYKKLS